jgi:synaptojanin
MLVIFAKPDVTAKLSDLETRCVKTGMFGMTGNKGAVAARVCVHGQSFAFVTAHLAAGQNNVEERNNDAATIENSLRFRHAATLKSGTDHVFWFGDLNYRIDSSSSTAAGFSNVDLSSSAEVHKTVNSLLAHDQLNVQRQTRRVFRKYMEGLIGFMPTYKYTIGTSDFDNGPKQRSPAWCDRVLYFSRKTAAAANHSILRETTQTTYESAFDIVFSDHKPVAAQFAVPICIIDHQLRAAVRRECITEQRTLSNQKKTNKSSLSTKDQTPKNPFITPRPIDYNNQIKETRTELPMGPVPSRNTTKDVEEDLLGLRI